MYNIFTVTKCYNYLYTSSMFSSTNSHASDPGCGGGGPAGTSGSGSGSGSGVFFLPDPFLDLGEDPNKICHIELQ